MPVVEPAPPAVSSTPPPPWDPRVVDALRPRAKALLRKRYRALRAALPPASVASRSEAIARHLVALDAWRSARTVAVFASMPHEVDTAPLVAEARARGCRVALPVVPDEPGPLRFRVAWEGDVEHPRAAGVWGIEEPTDAAPALAHGELDLVVVPCLAVDPSGHRLGYGRGYYDRTLSLCDRAVTAAVAFDFQLVAEVPAEARDVRVDWVVTDRGAARAAAP